MSTLSHVAFVFTTVVFLTPYVSICRADPQHPVLRSGGPGPGVNLFLGCPCDGTLQLQLVDVPDITTLEIKSEAGYFTGWKPLQIGGPFDVFTPNKLFVLSLNGMGNSDFGQPLAVGVTPQQLSADLLVDGSFVGGGYFDTVWIWALPEPSSFTLGLSGLLGLVGLRRRWSDR